MAKSTITDDPVSEQDKFMLRLPKGMRERIKRASEMNNRSMNSEIVERLQYSFGGADAEIQALFDKINDLEAQLARSQQVLRGQGYDVDLMNQLAVEQANNIRLEALTRTQAELIEANKQIKATSKGIIAFYENALRMLSRMVLSQNLTLPGYLKEAFEAWERHEGMFTEDEAATLAVAVAKMRDNVPE